MLDTKERLIFVYAHLPEKLRYLANPPLDITKDKYNDMQYLSFAIEMISELKEKNFDIRNDGVLPYEKDVIIGHFQSRIDFIKLNSGDII